MCIRDRVTVEGVFHANKNGFGFLHVDDSEDDMFIGRNDVGHAIDGDTVAAVIKKPADRLRGTMAEARVVEIVERSLKTVVGKFILNDEKEPYVGYIKSKNQKIQQPIYIKKGPVALEGTETVSYTHLMGQKIAIMSDKAQTTRNKIMGIYTTDKEQIVFIDTPGIHKPKTALGDFMVESAYSTLREVDTVLFMVPADEPRGKGDDMIIKRLKQAKVPVILVVNKIDKVHPDQLLEQIDDFRKQMDFKEIIPISALQGNNAVSYTHLDVYKRQTLYSLPIKRNGKDCLV